MGIELKTEEGRVSDGQKDMAKNGVYSVCRSVEEVVKLVKSLGRK